MKYPDKTVLVIDHGMYSNVADKLSEEFGTVLYFTFWEGSFPRSNDILLGSGFPNFKRVNSFWDKIDTIDLFVFTDIFHSDIQVYLQSIGKRVWGARQGDAMEIYRWDFLQYMKKIGLAIPPSDLVIGLDALRKELKKKEDVFIKIDAMTRGDFETFHHENYDLTEPMLDDLAFRLGPKAKIMKFIVQKPIETDAEIGYDGYTIDGKFPDECLYGIEVKDKGYVGKVASYDSIPKEIKFVNDKLAPTLKSYGYRANISTEIRVGKDGTPYLIDLTCRMPCPPTSVMMEMISNYAEIMYEGASGKMIQPIFKAKFGAELIGYSDFANDHFFNINVPKDVPIKQSSVCMIDGKNYCIPQGWESQAVFETVAIGDDLDKVISDVSKQGESIKGFGLKCSGDCLKDATEELKKM